MIIDTHAHYEDRRFDEDRKELLSSLLSSGVGLVVNASASMEGARETLALTERFANVYGMLGIHPEDAGKVTKDDLQWLKAQCRRDKIVAVGEIGLDYYWEENPPREVQCLLFREQIRIAKEVGLPINVHSRDAAKDTMDMILEEDAPACGGIIHCFSYSPEIALEYVRLGFYIGIGGVLTFQNAKKLKAVAAAVPSESIVLETDCPYLAPDPFRGKRNDSSYLTYVVKALAQIKGCTEEEITRITEENARKVYRLWDN